MVNDDAFEQYAREQEAAAAAAAARGNQSSGASYEQLMWTGLETGQMKIIRAVGGPPNSGLDVATARTVRISRIIGDDGRQFRCILPERAESPDHLLWRIITRVRGTEWVDGKRVSPVELKHPQIFNIIAHNGLTPADKAFIFDRGWEGREVLIMNVIDRAQMDWHTANKHTMLLSRNIGESKDGSVKFPEEGVPSYGFSAHLANLFKFYKSWEKYDIGILRTGQKETPYRIINASKYIEEVPAALQNFVSNEPLSAEETTWERYDLSKLFGVTRYTKIFNKLQITIARIDAALGTHYLEELKDLVEKEKAEFESMREEAAPAETTPIESQPAPVRRVVTPSDSSTVAFDTSLLKGWTVITQAERDAVAGITVKDNVVVDIQYKNPDATLLACPSCNLPGTDDATACPACGLAFV